MATLDNIRADSDWRQILEGQPQHLILTILLTVGAVSLLRVPVSPEGAGLLGLWGSEWAGIGIALAILHQVIVAIVFRLQLHQNLLTELFDDRDMKLWAMVFMPLLVARPLGAIMTGWADDVPITGHRWLEIPIGAALLGVAIWGMYSTLKFFTLRRALGGDHFREEIRELPKVQGGVFDYTDNGMYGVVFLGLWGIALLFGSWNALVLALFQHAYIWVHMYCTEAPDMRRMYGSE